MFCAYKMKNMPKNINNFPTLNIIMQIYMAGTVAGTIVESRIIVLSQQLSFHTTSVTFHTVKLWIFAYLM